MFANLLCKNDCKQATVYVVAQSVWILLYIGFVVALLHKSKVSTAVLGPLVIMIVMTVIFYYLINYLCDNDHDTVAWIISLLPYVSAVVWGYYMVPLMMTCMKTGSLQSYETM